MVLLSSRDNSLIKDYLKLSAQKSHRRRSGRCALEGLRLIRDALQSGVRIENAFFTHEALSKHAGLLPLFKKAGASVYEISEPLAAAISDTDTTQGLLCTAYIPQSSLSPDNTDTGGCYAALENIQDPGNLGAILRTAEALGFDGIFLSPACVDVYSPKVLRASMGAVFRLPICETPLPLALKKLGGAGIKTYAALSWGGEDLLAQDLSGGVAVAIGNEGAGLTAECAAVCLKSVTIKMRGRAESFNAAAAAAIIMWETVKNR